jgi:hypothetical protein
MWVGFDSRQTLRYRQLSGFGDGDVRLDRSQPKANPSSVKIEVYILPSDQYN